MPKENLFDKASAAADALAQAGRAIEPLEMRLHTSSIAPLYVYWAWAGLALGIIMLGVWALAGAPHLAIPFTGLVLVVLATLVLARHGWRRLRRHWG